jgi:hypothetical protein
VVGDQTVVVMDNQLTPQHLLSRIEARCGDAETARMLRLRLAISQASSSSCWGDDRPTALLSHWLDIVSCERSPDSAEPHEREQLTRVLVQWLDEQRTWRQLTSTPAVLRAPLRSEPLTLHRPLVAGRGDLRRWWDHFERIDPATHARGRELACAGVYAIEIGHLRGSVRVMASSGSFYVAVLRWRSGLLKSPRTVTPTCSCLDRCRWCKHSIAATYHLIERSWRAPVQAVS